MTVVPTRHASRSPAGDFAPASFVALVILVAATIPVPAPSTAPQWTATAVHVGLYFALCAALLSPWRHRGWPLPRVGPFVAAVTYGALHELWQGVLPYRTAAVGDVLADAAGAALAIAVTTAAGRPSSAP